MKQVVIKLALALLACVVAFTLAVSISARGHVYPSRENNLAHLVVFANTSGLTLQVFVEGN